MKVDSVPAIKMRIAANPIFGNQCFVCEKQFSHKRLPVIHHRWYKEGQVRSSDQKRTPAWNLAYHTQVEKDVSENPKQFMLLCNPHHRGLHKIKNYKSNLDRMMQAVRMTV